MFAACLASRAGEGNVGRTATINSRRFVTAAKAAAVDQASNAGASGPLMSLRFSSAISVRSNPISSLRRARRLAYFHVASICSSSTFRNQPPKTGSQYPERIKPPPFPSQRRRPAARAEQSREFEERSQQNWKEH